MVERLTAAADTASVAAAAPAVAQWSTDRIRSAPRPLLGPPHYASKGLTFIIQYDWTAWKEMKFSHMILYKTGKSSAQPNVLHPRWCRGVGRRPVRPLHAAPCRRRLSHRIVHSPLRHGAYYRDASPPPDDVCSVATGQFFLYRDRTLFSVCVYSPAAKSSTADAQPPVPLIHFGARMGADGCLWEKVAVAFGKLFAASECTRLRLRAT